jgi:hypothetical protein
LHNPQAASLTLRSAATTCARLPQQSLTCMMSAAARSSAGSLGTSKAREFLRSFSMRRFKWTIWVRRLQETSDAELQTGGAVLSGLHCECRARGMLPYIKLLLLYTHLRISNLLAPTTCS